MAAAMTAETLEDLLQRCRDGDADGFSEVYRQLSRSLYGTALRMLANPEDAEEAVHDAFISFYRRVPDLPGSQLPAWLHRVVVNECIDRLRRRKRWQQTEINEQISQAPLRQDSLSIDLKRAVARLPKRARMVFVLHDVEGFKHREIGEMMNLSVGATKSQLFRARELLRRHMSRSPRAV